MVTIKDVAAAANLSPSTVSIVLKGNGDVRKISKKTQQKVLETARALGYTPNTQAKILRGGSRSSAVITLFWATDIRTNILSRFLNGLQSALLEHKYACELQIKPYKVNRLHEALTSRTLLGSNGMIICNASEIDMEYLEKAQFYIPTVLYNRYSKRYATVNMDDRTIGTLPARIFAKHQKKRPALLKAPATFNGMNIRTNVFEYETNQAGMEPPVSILVNDSMRGGYEGAMRLCGIDPFPDCLFCTSDAIARGALKAFYNNHIKVPEQIEIISVGNGNIEQQEFSIPSLSVIQLPMEQMAAACLQIVYERLTAYEFDMDNRKFPVSYVARESCPD